MIDQEKMGNAIAILRKEAGFTQQDLADRIGVSDKAVSKWERGICIPDVSCLTKLSIILDTDTDSLLNGAHLQLDECWNGLLILNDDKIPLSTIIYDKPLASYLFSYFLLVGIKKIYVECTEQDKKYLESFYQGGSKLGVEIIYHNRSSRLAFDDKCTNVMVMYGRSFIYGVDQTRFFQRAMIDKKKPTILSIPKEVEEDGLFFDEDKKVVFKKKLHRQYSYYRIPLCFLPKNRVEAFKAENFAVAEDFYTEVLDRGFVEITVNDYESVNNLSNFVKIVQQACCMDIYDLEEIAWRRGMISLDRLGELAKEKENEYLMRLYEKRNAHLSR